jgi:hypothetical protein
LEIPPTKREKADMTVVPVVGSEGHAPDA